MAHDLEAPQYSSVIDISGVTYDAPEIALAIEATFEAALLNVIRFGNAIGFLTGYGQVNAPLSTPVIVSSQKTSQQLTQQSLWGTANAFHFTTVGSSMCCVDCYFIVIVVAG